MRITGADTGTDLNEWGAYARNVPRAFCFRAPHSRRKAAAGVGSSVDTRAPNLISNKSWRSSGGMPELESDFR